MLCDGWEYATGYDRLMTHADHGQFAVAMPTVRDQDGDIVYFWCELTTRLVPLIFHPDVRLRQHAIAELTRAAVESAHRFIEGAPDGT